MLRRAIERLATLGYRAEVGVEIEFHLLREDGQAATRVELRTGGADAQPHWAIAALLAAVAAGIEAEDEPGPRGAGNLYAAGRPLPRTLADAVAAARADETITEILGRDAVHDFLALADLEWRAFIDSVTDWDRQRYLRSV